MRKITGAHLVHNWNQKHTNSGRRLDVQRALPRISFRTLIHYVICLCFLAMMYTPAFASLVEFKTTYNWYNTTPSSQPR